MRLDRLNKWTPPSRAVRLQSQILSYTTIPFNAETWADFAGLVEAHNGVWGGCWSMGFHPEGVGRGQAAEGNRDAKRAHTMAGTVHQILVYVVDECVGWCQYGTPAELPTINNRKKSELGAEDVPTWRIGCLFTAAKHRERGVARAAVRGTLDAIAQAGGGLSRPTPSRPRSDRHSAATTSTPVPRHYASSSDSFAIAKSLSGDG
jgi:hypothetical protein